MRKALRLCSRAQVIPPAEKTKTGYSQFFRRRGVGGRAHPTMMTAMTTKTMITTSMMPHQVRLLPGLTLTAQFVFTVIFGPLGLLLALPLAVVMQVVIREVVIRDLLDGWKRQHPRFRSIL